MVYEGDFRKHRGCRLQNLTPLTYCVVPLVTMQDTTQASPRATTMVPRQLVRPSIVGQDLVAARDCNIISVKSSLLARQAGNMMSLLIKCPCSLRCFRSPSKHTIFVGFLPYFRRLSSCRRTLPFATWRCGNHVMKRMRAAVVSVVGGKPAPCPCAAEGKI